MGIEYGSVSLMFQNYIGLKTVKDLSQVVLSLDIEITNAIQVTNDSKSACNLWREAVLSQQVAPTKHTPCLV